MNRSRSRDDTLSGTFHFRLHLQSVQSCYGHYLRIASSRRSDWILLAKCCENEGFAVILGVWKVLAPLLHHLLNSVSAVSSWLEFVAEACLFGVSCCLTSCYTSVLEYQGFQSPFSYRYLLSLRNCCMLISKNVG